LWMVAPKAAQVVHPANFALFALFALFAFFALFRSLS